MSRCAFTVIAAPLLAAQAALAVLGQCGMHLALHACGVAHDHGAAAAACQHHHAVSDGKRHCCHHHARSGQAKQARDDDENRPDPHGHEPRHDSDDCVVCHYFAAAALEQVGVPEVIGELLESEARAPRPPDTSAADRFVQPIRGPPGPGR